MFNNIIKNAESPLFVCPWAVSLLENGEKCVESNLKSKEFRKRKNGLFVQKLLECLTINWTKCGNNWSNIGKKPSL